MGGDWGSGDRAIVGDCIQRRRLSTGAGQEEIEKSLAHRWVWAEGARVPQRHRWQSAGGEEESQPQSSRLRRSGRRPIGQGFFALQQVSGQVRGFRRRREEGQQRLGQGDKRVGARLEIDDDPVRICSAVVAWRG